MLAEKEEVVVLNKCDTLNVDDAEEAAAHLQEKILSPVHLVSAASGYGVWELMRDLQARVEVHRDGSNDAAQEEWHP